VLFHPGSAAAAALLVCIAGLTDLRQRRIPNWLTFPSMALGLAMQASYAGWKGLLFGFAGLAIAPSLLLLLHLGRGIGMGDVKLMAALGAILGPFTAMIVVLASALAGAVLAGLVVFGAVRQMPLAWRGPKSERLSTAANLTMPYGIAIGIGTLVTLAITWVDGGMSWLF